MTERRPISEPTLRSDPAALPSICATATMGSSSTHCWRQALLIASRTSAATASRLDDHPVDHVGGQRNGLVIDQPRIVGGRREAVKVVLSRPIGELCLEVRLCVLTLVVHQSVAQLARIRTRSQLGHWASGIPANSR